MKHAQHRSSEPIILMFSLCHILPKVQIFVAVESKTKKLQ